MSSEDEGENDLERIIEGDDQEEANHQEAVEIDEEDGGNDDENKENEDEEKERKVVKPKRVIKNPRPKLNTLVLKGPKGVGCLENYFKNIKFKGAGAEAEDLRTIMKTYEYWCHRLFPKYPFDECLEKIEKLGTKKDMQTYIKRIRLGMDDFGTSKEQVSDKEEEHEEETNNDRIFNTLTSPPVDVPAEEKQLSEEQLERIRINKERAERLRMERLQKLQARADSVISESNTLENSAAKAPSLDAIEDNNQTSDEQLGPSIPEHTSMECE